MKARHQIPRRPVLVCFGSSSSRTINTQVAERYENDLLQAWRFQHRAEIALRDRANREEQAFLLSWLLQHSVRPSFDDLTTLSKLPAAVDRAPDDWFHRWCLHTVVSADNPFIPGITLSVLLGERAEIASEGEQRTLISLRDRVDAVLLEVLERLPKTVQGFENFEGGVKSCSAMFEPNGQGQDPRYLPGPLAVALQSRRQMEVFSAAPLVMDFLSLVFKKGLPDLRDTTDLRRNPEELKNLCDEGGHKSLAIHIFDEHGGHGGGSFLQGTTASSVGKMTVLPGAQFIVAGVAAKPHSYYDVPALRMMLDFLVYVGMLVLFCVFVLLFEDGESSNEEGEVIFQDVVITRGEIVFAVYLAVSEV